jgi:hypothetical protein
MASFEASDQPGITRRSWRRLDSRPKHDRGLRVLTGLSLLLIIATHVARYQLDGMSIWLFMLSFVPTVVFIVLDPARAHRANTEDESKPAPGAASVADDTSVGTLVSIAIGLTMAATMPYALGLAAWDTLVWLTSRLSDGTLAGFRPDSIAGEAIGGAAVLVAGIGTVIWQIRKQRAIAATTTPAST